MLNQVTDKRFMKPDGRIHSASEQYALPDTAMRRIDMDDDFCKRPGRAAT